MLPMVVLVGLEAEMDVGREEQRQVHTVPEGVEPDYPDIHQTEPVHILWEMLGAVSEEQREQQALQELRGHRMAEAVLSQEQSPAGRRGAHGAHMLL